MTALLERERALDLIDEALRRARDGDAGVVLLVGEAGLGKTTLLAEASRRATGFTVVSTACSEVETSLPFAVLDRVLRKVGSRAGLPSRDPMAPVDARMHRYARMLGWLRDGSPRPLLVAMDDLHWSDPDSLGLLALLCRRLGGSGVALVATMRPWPVPASEHAELLAYEEVGALDRLRPLTHDASAALLGGRLGEHPGVGRLEHAGIACAGNPLMLVEVAEAWRRGEDPLAASAGGLAERLLLPRFAGVGGLALRWARAASVFGTRFSPSLVHPLAGQDEREALASLEALCGAHLVRALTGATAEFVHPLFRQVLYDDLAPPVRSALHAQAFRALHAQRADPAEAAVHALAADLRGNDGAVATLLAAARQAEGTGAVATAAEHLEGAIRLAGTTCDPTLRLELARVRLSTGDLAGAEESARQFLGGDQLPDTERAAGLRLLAQVLLASARAADAEAAWKAASDVVRPSDTDLAAEILLDATFMGWLFEGPRSARTTTQEICRILRDHPTEREELRLRAQAADAYLAVLGGDPSGLDGLAVSARAELMRVDAVPQAAWTWDVVWGYANLAKITERFDDNQALYVPWADRARRSGASLTYQAMAVNQADALWRIGRLDDALALLKGAAELADVAPMLAPFVAVGMTHLHHEMGAEDDAARWARRVDDVMRQRGELAYLRLWLSLFDCRRHLEAGRAGDAVTAAERAAAAAESSGILEPCLVPWHGPAIEAHLAAGDVERATELVASLERLCVPLPCHAPRAVAAAGRAAIAWRRGDHRRADDQFREALAHNEAVPMPLAEAETLIGYGRFLRHSGQLREARGCLHRALELLEPIGAGRLRALAVEELSVAGGRRRQTGSSRSLTAQERRVAALAADGLTNAEIATRLFVSPKTVEHHLSHVYTRLGIRSRRELMRTWRDHADGGLAGVAAPAPAPAPAPA